MPRTILWFRNDLRLADNPIVAAAVANCKAGHNIVPLYCWDDRFMAANNVIDRKPRTRRTGEPKMGPFRAKFLLQSVNDLKQSLLNCGSDLFIYYKRPEHVIPGLMSGSGKDVIVTFEEVKSEEFDVDVKGLLSKTGKDVVFISEEVTSEELAVDNKVREAISGRARLQKLWGHTLCHIDDLPFAQNLSDLSDIFTPFKNKVEANCSVREVLPSPGQGELRTPEGLPATEEAIWESLPLAPAVKAQGPPATAPNCVLDFEGGETAALKRLKYYLWDKNLLKDYFNTRNGMLGGDYSTKLSPWLAHGCISPRTIYHEIKKYEEKREANKSTYWAVFELIWRDFYRFFAVKHGSKIFFETGISGQKLKWNKDMQLFEDWKAGRTGMPLVDANMRELKCTGFMSNRGRQNVASYLVLDLGIDWRLGADWFEHLLIDHDVTSNWGNWVAAAGLTGGRINKFNILRQSKEYDENGDYVRTWLPELAKVPKEFVHEPASMPPALAADIGFQIGRDYPKPVPVSRMRRPHRGNRYPDKGSPRRQGSPRKGRGPGGGKQRRVPVNMY